MAPCFGQLAFGRKIFYAAPGQRQVGPVSNGEGRFFLVADIRLDNRRELIRNLGDWGSVHGNSSDSELLLAAIERWKWRCFDHLVGDYAFAVFDRLENQLTLARDPSGALPLSFHVGSECCAFASLPSGLFSVPRVSLALDMEKLARFIADTRESGSCSYFKKIESVQPGHVVQITPEHSATTRFWYPPDRPSVENGRVDYVEEFRAMLDAAVDSRLVDAGPIVATHLSSGFDSNAVAATAARLMQSRNGRVVAATAAPNKAYVGLIPSGQIGDESRLAAVTAKHYSVMDHLVVRSNNLCPLDNMAELMPLIQTPELLVCNATWGAALQHAVRERGCHVMLTGGMGNLALSAGGPSALADFVSERQWGQWWSEARALTRSSSLGWRAVLLNSFGGSAPAWAIRLRRQLRPSRGWAGGSAFLAAEWRAKGAADGWDLRPGLWVASRAARAEVISNRDPGLFLKGTAIRSGVEERDPTSDRRLVEFCLSLPPMRLLQHGVGRPLFREAMGDRVPREILENPLRGYQFPDWHVALPQHRLRQELDRAASDPVASALLDIGSLRRAVDEFPQAGWHLPENYAKFRVDLLRAMSAASFIRTFADRR